MNGLKFNSQVCTNIKQSQRLLDLGLKPETADMYYTEGSMDAEGDIEYHLNIKRYWISLPLNYIPAWSLHRLMELFTNSVTNESDAYILNTDNTFDAVIDDIEWCINKGYFNKEYLKQ